MSHRFVSEEEQELIDAFANMSDLSRHMFKLKCLVGDNEEYYSSRVNVIRAKSLIREIQQNNVDNLEHLNELKRMFRRDGK